MPTLMNPDTIATAIKAVLDADADVSAIDGIGVAIEPQNWKGTKPFVAIYFDSWDTQRPTISAGTTEHMILHFELVCLAKVTGNIQLARTLRDDLISKVINALMKNRSLNDNARTSYPAGGSAAIDAPGDFLVAATIRWDVEVQAVT